MNTRPELHRLLHSVISQWAIAEGNRRNDPFFDAYDHLAQAIGHKGASTLRKMCLPRDRAQGAKLGFEDALTISAETGDARLVIWFIEEFTLRRKDQTADRSTFSTPVYDLSAIAATLNQSKPRQ